MLRSAVSRQAWGFNFTLTPIIVTLPFYWDRLQLYQKVVAGILPSAELSFML